MSPRAMSYELVQRLHALHWDLRQLRARIDMGEPARLVLVDAREITLTIEGEAERARQLVAALEEQEGVDHAPPRERAPCCGGRGPRARRDGSRWDSAPLDASCPDCGARAVIMGAPSDVLAAFDACRPSEIDPDYRRAS